MNRIVFYADSEDLGYIFKEYSNYYTKLITEHTKTYYTKQGAFYVTKFNPDALVYEAITKENNPFIQPMTKNKLLDTSKALSGLDIKNYSVLRSKEKGMIGIIFDPLSEEEVAEVMRLVND